MPRLLSIQTAPVAAHGFRGAENIHDAPWITAFFKQSVTGPIHATRLGLVGDEQADTVHHGGPDKAICCYPSEHFPHWQAMPGLEAMGAGGFGENFTTSGHTESDVCIGDIFSCGTATFQITQPRQPCWKLASRWRTKGLTAWAERDGLTGWYLRVLTEGAVQANDELTLIDRPNPDWTIARANEIAHHQRHDREQVAALAAVPYLSASWHESFTRLAASLTPS